MGLFFKATGGAATDPKCMPPENFFAWFGKCLATGFVSVLASAIPMTCLSTLHTREYVKFRERDSPQWKAQLRKWRRHDLVIWVFCLSFSGFCLFFTCVFIANVTEKA